MRGCAREEAGRGVINVVQARSRSARVSLFDGGCSGDACAPDTSSPVPCEFPSFLHHLSPARSGEAPRTWRSTRPSSTQPDVLRNHALSGLLPRSRPLQRRRQRQGRRDGFSTGVHPRRMRAARGRRRPQTRVTQVSSRPYQRQRWRRRSRPSNRGSQRPRGRRSSCTSRP